MSEDRTTAAKGPNPLDKTGSSQNPTYSATNSQLNSMAMSNPNNTAGYNVDVRPLGKADHGDAEFLDYYRIMGVVPSASQTDIDLAYRKKASEHLPEVSKDDRVTAQKKFNQVSQAYATLSDPARRDYYDQLALKPFSKADALKQFDSFFREFELLPEETEFFKKHDPNRPKNYYEILGVRKNASKQEISEAFRKLSMEYHPKNRKDKDANAEKEFTQICEAYNHLQDDFKRQTYDALSCTCEIPSEAAYKQFNDKFEDEKFEDTKDEEVIRPFVKKASLKKEIQAKKAAPVQASQTRHPSTHHGKGSSHVQAGHTNTGTKPSHPAHASNATKSTGLHATGTSINTSSTHHPAASNATKPTTAATSATDRSKVSSTNEINSDAVKSPPNTPTEVAGKANETKPTKKEEAHTNTTRSSHHEEHTHHENEDSHKHHYEQAPVSKQPKTKKKESYIDFLKMNHEYVPHQGEYGYRPYEWVSSTYNMAYPEEAENYNNHYEEEVTHEIVTVPGPDGPVTKRISYKNTLANGKERREKYEEVLHANGDGEIIESIRDDEGEHSNKWLVKEGVRQPVPNPPAINK